MRNVMILVLAFAVRLAGAQLSDAQAIDIAERYASICGVDLNEATASVRRESRYVAVLDGRIFVHLDHEGRFLAFVDSKISDPNPGAERYASDDDVWRAVEALATRLGAPRGLVRDQLERRDNDPKGNIFWCRLTKPVHGYRASPGNGVYATIRRSDGAILEFWVSRGWSADPPDVRISETEVRQIACSLYGGHPGSWSVGLRYVPDERRPGTQRLAYTMGRGQPGGSVGLIIDAKTGEVIRHGLAADQPEPPPGYKPGTVVEGWEPNPGPGPSKGAGKKAPLVVYVACAALFGGSLFLLWRVMRR
jgi:hypothetical protein